MIAGIAGFLAGIISGMGVGGGVVLIPMLAFFLGLGQRAAQGVNLCYFLPTAAAALFVHTKNKNVEYKKAGLLLILGLPLSLLGAWGAAVVSAVWLRRLFGIFLAIFGAIEVYGGFTNKE
ncbi:MAG: TSUP family transporter [Clostridia bacterium]|nr:TSUP family transporter [Clostridia bacterium]